MIRLLLVDDQTIVRQGLRVLLEAQPDLQVIGEAENGRQAVEQVANLQPDVVLMDIHMPERDGVSATQIICQHFSEIHVLILSTFADTDYVARAMQFGAKGYLLKDTSAEGLALAIRAVYKGHTHLGPELFPRTYGNASTLVSTKSHDIIPEIAELTDREKEIFHLIGTGANNQEIAQALHISISTVKNHITHIFHRLKLRDRVQAALLANACFNDHSNYHR
jgi:DNA-binding NarL/FixJ family response regulator